MIPSLTYVMEVPIWMHPDTFLERAQENGFLEACNVLNIEIAFESESRGSFTLILTGNSLVVMSVAQMLNELGIKTPSNSSLEIPEA